MWDWAREAREGGGRKEEVLAMCQWWSRFGHGDGMGQWWSSHWLEGWRAGGLEVWDQSLGNEFLLEASLEVWPD